MKWVGLSWVFDTLYILLLLSLSASIIQFTIRAVLRIKIPLNLAALILISMYVAIAWRCFYQTHIPLNQVLPWIAWALAIGLGCQLVVMIFNKQWQFEPPEWRQWFKGAWSFLIFVLLLITIYSVMIADSRLPVLLRINNDIWIYSKYAQLALNQPWGNNVIGFDLFQSDLIEQTPSAFFLLSILSWLLHKPVIDIASLGLILLIAYSAHLIKTICQEYFQLKKSLCWLIALCWLTGPMIAKLTVMYFLAQWTGITLFLMALLVNLQSRPLAIQLSLLSLLYYLLYMSYPGFYTPFVFSLLFMRMIIAFYRRQLEMKPWWTSGLISAMGAIPISAALGIGLDPTHCAQMVLTFKKLANEPYFLSERILLNPFTFLSMPTLPSLFFHWLMGLLLVGLALYLSLGHRFQRSLRLLLLTVLSALFYMVYPTYFALFLALLLITKTGDVLFYKRAHQAEYFNAHLIDILMMLPLLLMAIYWLWPSIFIQSAYKMVTHNYVMARGYDVDAGTVSSNLIGNFILMAGIIYYLYKRYKTQVLTAKQLALASLFLGNIAFYLGYFAYKGFSYQQWKLAASLVQPLSFLPIIAVLYLLAQNRFVNTRVQEWLLILVIIINATLFGYIMTPWNIAIQKYAGLRGVMALDKDPAVTRVIIDLQEAHDVFPRQVRGTIATVQFLQIKPLYTPGLYTPARAPKASLAKGEVLITNRCDLSRSDTEVLGYAFCMIRGHSKHSH